MNLQKSKYSKRGRPAAWVSLIAAVLAMAAAFFGGAGVSSAEPAASAAGPFFQLRPAHASTKCLDVRNNDGGTANGTPIQLFDCLGAGQTNQVWQAVAVGGGFFQLRPAHAPTKCLDVRNNNGGTANGTPIQLFDCLGTGQANQLWRSVQITPILFQLRPMHAQTKCLDVRNNDGGTANGTPIQLFDCLGSGQTNQQWRIVTV
ncbi:MAG TPA: RICIN domain-containing protein [Actinophytocola sp.]|uniref:RICIN domain-containing protein n=1 Tax=Actinophytocola sp. TaxID=1872138 RepID=UPI002DB5D4CC|nr:RICIN domain-containing protein [Actinophytocola sp.]HEU5474384.1 RICIN domain-containing protein [Actinophytocola sp.]